VAPWRPITPARSPKALTADIGRLFAVHKGKYGSPLIYADLRDEGWKHQCQHRRDDHA
jgi:hypothetical protein